MVDGLCLFDMDPGGAELNDPLGELYQDLVHRLFEAPGSNIDDADRGVGIEQMLSGAFDRANGGQPSEVIARRIEADFRKDDRVSTVSAAVVETSPGQFRVQIQVVCDESVLGITLVSDGLGGVKVVL